MTEQLTKVVVDCSTGEQKVIPLTAAEIAQRDQDAAAAQEEQSAREAEAQRIADLKASAKAKLVAGQPLTEEEASVITL